MKKEIFASFIEKIKLVTNNECLINLKSVNTKNNVFLQKILSSEKFKNLTLNKIKRLYETYKSDEYAKKVIFDNTRNLFKNAWEGSYSELTAYDAINLAFDTPCEMQLNAIPIEQTLAKYCPNTRVSKIDGFQRDVFMYFEIKTLHNRFHDMINKIKQKLVCFDKEKYFYFKSNYNFGLEIHGDEYQALYEEIKKAKENKEPSLCSKVIKGLNFQFFYVRKNYISEFHICENEYEMAQRLEKFPLKDYKQFVNNTNFVKIFVCNEFDFHSKHSFNGKFFRALSRRVFCKLTKEQKRYDENSNLTTAYIAKTICGLMFIIDLSLDDKNNIESVNDLYRIYFYKNPNSRNKKSQLDISFTYQYLNRLNLQECDDFEADNY